jgi:hypothetical protein
MCLHFKKAATLFTIFLFYVLLVVQPSQASDDPAQPAVTIAKRIIASLNKTDRTKDEFIKAYGKFTLALGSPSKEYSLRQIDSLLARDPGGWSEADGWVWKFYTSVWGVEHLPKLTLNIMMTHSIQVGSRGIPYVYFLAKRFGIEAVSMLVDSLEAARDEYVRVAIRQIFDFASLEPDIRWAKNDAQRV